MIRGDCRSILGVLAGMTDESLRPVGYLTFCELFKNHSKASLSTLFFF